MSAPKENSLNHNIKKLGVIAGSGILPRDLYFACREQGIECFIVGFKKDTNHLKPDFWGSISKSSQILDYFNRNNIDDLIFIGGVTRPSFLNLRPDWVTFKFFFKSFFKSFGDSSLLDAARNEMESMGFTMHGVHEFLPDLLMSAGVLGQVDVPDTNQQDINVGVKAAKVHGQDDLGQAVLVCDGQVIATESSRGTNHMIENYGREGAVLVKMCKPQQDKDMDLPTIGSKTVQLCVNKGIVGIVGEAGATLMADQGRTVTLANQNNIFIVGHAYHA